MIYSLGTAAPWNHHERLLAMTAESWLGALISGKLRSAG